MQAVATENIELAAKIAILLSNYYELQKDDTNKGWAAYLKANVERKLFNNNAADSLLKLSQKQFTLGKNQEGLKWVQGSKQFWQAGNKINVGVQNGNLFGFEIAQSSDPRFFATGGADNLIKIWDRNLGKEILTLADHTDEINALEYSSNGRYLASVGNDKLINIYNAYNYSLPYRFKDESRRKKNKIFFRQ